MKYSSTSVVLLATDGSDDAALAARLAVDLCAKTGAELDVVHVWQRAKWLLSSPGTVLRSDLPKESAARLLKEQVERIRTAGGKVEGSHLRMGHPAHEIAILGGELNADLVVVGTQGIGTTRRASTEVLRTADGSALVFPPTGKDGNTIEEGALSSNCSEQSALDFAVFALVHARCGNAVIETRLDEHHMACWCMRCDELSTFESRFEREIAER